MKKLIIARHGDAPGTHLTLIGQLQIEQLAEKLACSINGDSVTILSSKYDRAVESAEIIAGKFGGIVEKADGLIDCDSDRQSGRILDALRLRMTADVVILVAHLPVVKNFPLFFGTHELGTDLNPDRESPPQGSAWIIDCEAKTIQVV